MLKKVAQQNQLEINSVISVFIFSMTNGIPIQVDLPHFYLQYKINKWHCVHEIVFTVYF